MSTYNQKCCDDLFTEFEFQDLRNAEPPDEKGVYVIRVKRRGLSTIKIVEEIKQHLQGLKWELAKNYICSRIERLKKINQCPVIYIGSAGGKKGSKNTLKGRYEELAGRRHTVMYPILALLYFGWELEFGWKVDNNPSDLEEELKRKYRIRHNGKLPALVER